VTRSPSRGEARHFTVKAGDRTAVDAALRYADSRSPSSATSSASTGRRWTDGSRRTRRSTPTRATPTPGSTQKIAGLVCFYNEEVDLFIDDQLQERPVTKFSNARKERSHRDSR
jgi:hypothetical protein